MPGPSSSTVTVSQPSAWRAFSSTRSPCLRGVADEIGDAAAKAERAEQRARLAFERRLDHIAAAPGGLGDLLEQRRKVDRLRRLAGVALREGEIVLQHAAHLVDVGAERLGVGRVAEQRELELEAGQHGAKIVADAGEHGGALLDLPLDAFAHVDEGLCRLPHLARAARPEDADRPALAELLGGVGERAGSA